VPDHRQDFISDLERIRPINNLEWIIELLPV